MDKLKLIVDGKSEVFERSHDGKKYIKKWVNTGKVKVTVNFVMIKEYSKLGGSGGYTQSFAQTDQPDQP